MALEWRYSRRDGWYQVVEGAPPYSPDLFEDAPIMPQSNKYHLNGRCPLWVVTQEPYRHVRIGKALFWIRPDLAERRAAGELSDDELLRMLVEGGGAGAGDGVG